MSTGSERGQGPAAEESLSITHNPLDGAGQHQTHIHHVGHEIAQSTEPGELPLKAPRKHALWVGTVTDKEAAPIVGESAEPPLPDQLPCVLDQWSPSVVVPNKGENTSLAGQPLDLSRLSRVLSYGFLAEDMLARPCGGLHDGKVHIVRRRDVHHLHIRRGGDLLPADCVPLEAELFAGLLGTLLDVIRTHDESGLDSLVAKPLCHVEIRTAVHRSHPPHPDHPHAHDSRHLSSLSTACTATHRIFTSR